MKTSRYPVVIHETDQDGRHRIALHKGPGDLTTGKWAHTHEIAEHLGYYHPGSGHDQLPQGIFRIKQCGYEILASHTVK